MDYEVEIKGDFLKALLPKDVLERAMQKAVDKAAELVDAHFDTRQSEWKPLEDKTVARRLALGFAATPILVRTGTLRKNAVQSKKVTAQEGEISTAFDYAAYADKVRSFYNMSDADNKAIAEAFVEGLTE